MYLPNLSIEKQLWANGSRHIIGIDEVGRGSWAGPLVAAGVILPQNFKVPYGLADSKKLSHLKRAQFSRLICEKAVAFNIAEISPFSINKIGIAKATQKAFRKIINSITPAPDFHLIDAFYIKYLAKSKQYAVKYGDSISASIAAASIIAKVYRDDLMVNISQIYPNYAFEKHKGYGTKLHQQNIKKFGFCKIHRTSYNLNYLIS